MEKIDFKKVDGVLVDIITGQAEEQGVSPNEIAVILYCLHKRSSYRTRVKLFSKTESFETIEEIRLKKLTSFDIMGHISKAIMQIFEGVVFEHNNHLKNGSSYEGIKNYPKTIALDKIELNCEIDITGNAVMALIYNNEFVRMYDLSEEFGDADLEEIKNEMN